jgi:hypothetical protein
MMKKLMLVRTMKTKTNTVTKKENMETKKTVAKPSCKKAGKRRKNRRPESSGSKR